MSFCLPKTEPSFVQNQIMFFISLMELLENSYWKPGPYLCAAFPLGMVLKHRHSIKLQKEGKYEIVLAQD